MLLSLFIWKSDSFQGFFNIISSINRVDIKKWDTVLPE